MGFTSGMKLLVVLSVLSLAASVAQAQWYSDGHITFYGSLNGGGTQAGACGYQNTYALGYGSMTAALSSTLFQGGAACGACFQLKCKPANLGQRGAQNWCWSYARTIIVTATNLCPPGSIGGWCNQRAHFDLPMPAFLTLARQEGGVAPVYYRRATCARSGGVRFTVGGNPWFLMVLIHNVGGAGDVWAVKIRSQSTGWIPMFRNWAPCGPAKPNYQAPYRSCSPPVTAGLSSPTVQSGKAGASAKPGRAVTIDPASWLAKQTGDL